uniref:Arf-GAP with coiled-coil, ANK repeat and PH domain-containing protein n=1 Tax=Eptatretus burgeri TaxID=7764 RepID=A0A8C4NEX1_EPTBU
MATMNDILQKVWSACPGNDKCADCGSCNPDWASLNLAVLLCEQCAGMNSMFL